MIVPSLFTLGIAAIATCWSFSTKEEIVKVAMGCLAAIAGFFALCYLPWIAKLLVISVPILLDRVQAWSANIEN